MLASIVAGSNSFPGAVEKLSDAITNAAKFPHLANEVANAVTLHEQWIRRAQAMERLDAVMKQVKSPPEIQNKTRKVGKPFRGEVHGPDSTMLEGRVKMLEVI